MQRPAWTLKTFFTEVTDCRTLIGKYLRRFSARLLSKSGEFRVERGLSGGYRGRPTSSLAGVGSNACFPPPSGHDASSIHHYKLHDSKSACSSVAMVLRCLPLNTMRGIAIVAQTDGQSYSILAQHYLLAC